MTRWSSLFVVCVSLVGCLADTDSDPSSQNEDLVDETSSAVIEGSPEGVGLLAFLADEQTTFALLDGPVGLDRRAAENLVAHRDGPDGVRGSADDDPFDSVIEVDDIAYVGPSAISKMITYAAGAGFVPSGSELLGIYDGVSFTVDEASSTVTLANDTQSQPYWEPEQYELAAQYQRVLDILSGQLIDAQVYRIGYRYSAPGYTSPYLSGAIDVYIVGRSSDGHLVGLWTISVET